MNKQDDDSSEDGDRVDNIFSKNPSDKKKKSEQEHDEEENCFTIFQSSEGKKSRLIIPSWVTARTRRSLVSIYNKEYSKFTNKKKKKKKKKRKKDIPHNFGESGDDVAAFIQSPTNVVSQAIIDSGTKWHISRNKDDFKEINYDKRVRVQGVGGHTPGFFGVFKNNALGESMPAIYAPKLPVERLLSVKGIAAAGWSTTLTDKADFMTSRISGQKVQLAQAESGLPIIPDMMFTEDSSGFYFEMWSDDEQEEEIYCFEVDELQPARQSREKFLQHLRNCHISDDTIGKIKCTACEIAKG